MIYFILQVPAVAGVAQMCAEMMGRETPFFASLFGFLTGFYIGLMQVFDYEYAHTRSHVIE